MKKLIILFALFDLLLVTKINANPASETDNQPQSVSEQCLDYSTRSGDLDKLIIMTPINLSLPNVEGCIHLAPFPESLESYENEPEVGELKFSIENNSKNAVSCVFRGHLTFTNELSTSRPDDKKYLDCFDSKKIFHREIDNFFVYAKPEEPSSKEFRTESYICGLYGKIDCYKAECSYDKKETKETISDRPVNAKEKKEGKLCIAEVETKSCGMNNLWEKTKVRTYTGVYRNVNGDYKCMEETICQDGNDAYEVGEILYETKGPIFESTQLNASCYKLEFKHECKPNGKFEPINVQGTEFDKGYRTGKGQCDKKRSCSKQRLHGAKWTESEYCGNLLAKEFNYECRDGQKVLLSTRTIRSCNNSGGRPIPGHAI